MTRSQFAARAPTISRASTSIFLTTRSPLSAASAAPANLRWRSTPCMRKASAATSSRSPHMPASFWSGSKSRTSISWMASLPPSPSSRRTRPATLVPLSQPQPKFTTISACSTPAAAPSPACTAAESSSTTPSTRSPQRFSPWVGGRMNQPPAPMLSSLSSAPR